MEKFRKLGIIEPILKSIQEQNFEEPLEIQEKAIPLILYGKDVIASAATGSGKTLVFASGIIKTVEHEKGIQALVLTPTRELAEQVSKTLQKFSKNKHLEIIAVYGGVSINPQIYALRTADVVVGTPGRILDHIGRNTIRLDKLKILVLDEADRMLDMGFIRDVGKIIGQCPVKRQTLLFSATISWEISRLARRYMNHPVEISAEIYVDPSKMIQFYYDIDDKLKFSLLVHFLKNEKARLVMVFCNTQRNTDFVANNLKGLGIGALAIHGGYSQDKRNRTMETFREQNFPVLVCTDVAARGLDIKEVSHIYNYDIPKNSKDYIHRIGRTARAGKEGKVINILASRDYDNFGRIINSRDFSMIKGETPEIERIFIRFKDNRTRGFNYRRSNNFRQRDRGGFRHKGRDDFRYRDRNNFRSRSRFGNNRYSERRHERGQEGRQERYGSPRSQGRFRRRNNYNSRFR